MKKHLFLLFFLIFSFSSPLIADERVGHDYSYWRDRLKQTAPKQVLVEMFLEEIEIGDANILIILKNLGPNLFYQGNKGQHIEDFQRLILLAFFHGLDLDAYRKLYNLEDEIQIVRIWEAIFMLYAGDKPFMRSFEQQLQLAQRWAFKNEEAKSKIESILKEVEDFFFLIDRAPEEIIVGKDLRTMILIPAGDFILGAPPSEGRKDEHPQKKIYLEPYYIDQTEVTNDAFANFLNQFKKTKDQNGNRLIGLTSPTAKILLKEAHYVAQEGFENHPVTDVTWYGAKAYCEFYEKRLPTEFEWEKAAKGPTHRRYPWGDLSEPGLINSFKNEGDDQFSGTAPVGFFRGGKSPYGVLDMAGNVWEWTATLYDDTIYSLLDYRFSAEAWAIHTGYDGLDDGDYFTIRGGGWRSNFTGKEFPRCSARLEFRPFRFGDDIGFRCIADHKHK